MSATTTNDANSMARRAEAEPDVKLRTGLIFEVGPTPPSDIDTTGAIRSELTLVESNLVPILRLLGQRFLNGAEAENVSFDQSMSDFEDVIRSMSQQLEKQASGVPFQLDALLSATSGTRAASTEGKRLLDRFVESVWKAVSTTCTPLLDKERTQLKRELSVAKNQSVEASRKASQLQVKVGELRSQIEEYMEERDALIVAAGGDPSEFPPAFGTQSESSAAGSAYGDDDVGFSQRDTTHANQPAASMSGAAAASMLLGASDTMGSRRPRRRSSVGIAAPVPAQPQRPPRGTWLKQHDNAAHAPRAAAISQLLNKNQRGAASEASRRHIILLRRILRATEERAMHGADRDAFVPDPALAMSLKRDVPRVIAMSQLVPRQPLAGGFVSVKGEEGAAGMLYSDESSDTVCGALVRAGELLTDVDTGVNRVIDGLRLGVPDDFQLARMWTSLLDHVKLVKQASSKVDDAKEKYLKLKGEARDVIAATEQALTDMAADANAMASVSSPKTKKHGGGAGAKGKAKAPAAVSSPPASSFPTDGAAADEQPASPNAADQPAAAAAGPTEAAATNKQTPSKAIKSKAATAKATPTPRNTADAAKSATTPTDAQAASPRKKPVLDVKRPTAAPSTKMKVAAAATAKATLDAFLSPDDLSLAAGIDGDDDVIGDGGDDDSCGEIGSPTSGPLGVVVVLPSSNNRIVLTPSSPAAVGDDLRNGGTEGSPMAASMGSPRNEAALMTATGDAADAAKAMPSSGPQDSTTRRDNAADSADNSVPILSPTSDRITQLQQSAFVAVRDHVDAEQRRLADELLFDMGEGSDWANGSARGGWEVRSDGGGGGVGTQKTPTLAASAKGLTMAGVGASALAASKSGMDAANAMTPISVASDAALACKQCNTRLRRLCPVCILQKVQSSLVQSPEMLRALIELCIAAGAATERLGIRSMLSEPPPRQPPWRRRKNVKKDVSTVSVGPDGSKTTDSGGARDPTGGEDLTSEEEREWREYRRLLPTYRGPHWIPSHLRLGSRHYGVDTDDGYDDLQSRRRGTAPPVGTDPRTASEILRGRFAQTNGRGFSTMNSGSTPRSHSPTQFDQGIVDMLERGRMIHERWLDKRDQMASLEHQALAKLFRDRLMLVLRPNLTAASSPLATRPMPEVLTATRLALTRPDAFVTPPMTPPPKRPVVGNVEDVLDALLRPKSQLSTVENNSHVVDPRHELLRPSPAASHAIAVDLTRGTYKVGNRITAAMKRSDVATPDPSVAQQRRTTSLVGGPSLAASPAAGSGGGLPKVPQRGGLSMKYRSAPLAYLGATAAQPSDGTAEDGGLPPLATGLPPEVLKMRHDIVAFAKRHFQGQSLDFADASAEMAKQLNAEGSSVKRTCGGEVAKPDANLKALVAKVNAHQSKK